MILILSYIILFSFSNANFLEMKFYFNVNLSKIESSNFYNEIIFNQLSTNISIGTPQQIIPLSIKVKLSTLSITSSILPYKKIIKYNHNLSSTYYSDNFSNIESFEYDEFRKGIKSKEIFEINNNKNLSFDFIMTTETFSDVSGVLGLKTNSDENLEKYNFLNQLKEKNLISSSIFFFIFENLDNSPLNYKGKLIIGAYPHEYEPKKYNIENYFKMKATLSFKGIKQEYEVKYLEIYYGEEEDDEHNFSEESITYFDFARTIIIGTTKFQNYITEEFKKLYNEKCKQVYYRGFRVFLCDNDIDINKLKNINIYYGYSNYTFVLKPNDLFASYNNTLYYLINFYPSSGIKTWSLGITFLKKYNFVYDQEKKVIGFYNNKENDFSKTYLKIFLIISLIIIIILSSLYIHNIIFKKQRRIRANELEDNIDYIPYDKKT